ncbi:uncharacterized protein LOC125418997 [Ziziphus jujuba]|uniref:Uncharacterized protein LOC125418997 n=1 Tax=Ziziphus jujuba TaxID=326968 RepID=A0ABM4ABK4_ZIZJJ|nr:uncharacterized protein LOC125418997 [Ziziphus jujuba]XP_060674110.1 uncharacterized protein LOC125418997 [Ziziphus jujuba]XP_060674111.1 uncharacterized protein LOC125418997 [Ziziphus jujuba]XP_060674112.1 uncharacterized protein LOC125418997 [Ziziphus jujuba]
MEAGGCSNNNKGNEARRTWSKGEEEALLNILDEAIASGQRCDTGAFKPGTLNMIERQLAEMCPNSGLRYNPSAKSWRSKHFPVYERLANIFGKDRATGVGAQTPIDLVNDINMEVANEQFDDICSLMSVNQTHSEPSTQSQARRKRKDKAKDDDIVKGLDNVADKWFGKLAATLEK